MNTDFNAWDGDDTGDVDAFWDERNYLTDAGDVEAAVFAVHGLQDDNVRMDHVWKWWNGLPAGVPRKLWLLRSGHTDPFDSRRAVWVDTLHGWFDHFLYGIDNGIEDEPPVTIEDERDVWGDYASWPIPGTAGVPVYLQGTTAAEAGALRGASGGPLDSVSFTGTSQGAGATLAASVETNAMSSPTGSQAARRVFLSRPLARDIRLSGEAVVELQASLNAAQSNLGAIVVDYSATPFSQVTRSGEGTSNTQTRTCWGTPGAHDKACFLEISKPLQQNLTQWRVTRGILDSSNRGSLRTASPLSLGQAYGFTIPAQPTEHTFKAGHQIGVVIVGNLFGIAGTPGAQITLDTKLSRVVLPIAGGAAAARASGLTDESAPVTTPSAGAGWSRSGALTLQADDGDGSGVASITYSVGGGAPVTVAGAAAPLSLPDGISTVRFSATDRAGHEEAEKVLEVKVDGVAPSLSAALPAVSVFARGQTVAPVQPACSDGGSGVASCPPATAVDTATAGARELALTARDVAGNEQSMRWAYTVLGTLPKLGVKKRGALKLALTSPVRTSVRITGVARRGAKRASLRAARVVLEPGVTRVVTLRLARRLRGRVKVDVRLASSAGALRRADRVRL